MLPRGPTSPMSRGHKVAVRPTLLLLISRLFPLSLSLIPHSLLGPFPCSSSVPLLRPPCRCLLRYSRGIELSLCPSVCSEFQSIREAVRKKNCSLSFFLSFSFACIFSMSYLYNFHQSQSLDHSVISSPLNFLP